MEPSIIEMIFNKRSVIRKRWIDEMNNVKAGDEAQPISVRDGTNEEFFNLILDSLDLEQTKAKERLRQFVEKLMHKGWPLSYFTRGMQIFRRVLLETRTSDESIPTREVLPLFYEVESWVDGITNQMVDEYTGSWENTFHLQKLALNELSAPLMPVFDKISVMPLIGTIDTERARLIMENLLEGIIEYRSQVVLIDITGVPVVDTMVAHHIIKASEAVRLVGAECILVGIRPEIAQTIVNLGINLDKFPTKSTLRKGVETALELIHRKVVEI